MIKNKLNIAVIGCSTMAQFHMDGILKQEEARLYAVCDTAPERLEECRAKYSPERAVADFISCMTDRYATRIYQELFLPHGFQAV